jgi:hypothetical protein
MSGHFKCASHIVVEELLNVGLIPKDLQIFGYQPTEEQILACPRVSATDLRRTFDRLFGPDASKLLDGVERFGGDVSYLQLLEDGTYAYVPYSSLGGMGGADRISYVKSERDGDKVFVYVRYAYYSAPYPCIWIVGVRAGNSEPYRLLSTVDTSGWSVQPWTRVAAGEFDEYFPIYKHTFVSNGDGTYYWDSTELVEEGKQIPLSAIYSPPATEAVGGDGTASTATDNGETTAPVTDIPTTTDNGETTAPATDTPAPSDSSVPSDGAAEESSFPWVWVCIGGAVVIVALGAILLLKKKK